MVDFRIELFIFPDGTSVEMMVFDRSERETVAPASDRPADAARPAAAPLPSSTSPRTVDRQPDVAVAPYHVHVCPVCHGQLVHPIAWQCTAPATWKIRLRCPECEIRRTVVLDRQQVERLNRELYRGAQALAREVERVTRQNFEDEARHFIAALRSGDIQPIDF